jgi:hypothetical protein
MARWAIVTVALYIVMVTVLMAPLGYLTGGVVLFEIGGKWLLLVAAVILLSQLLMLIFPVRMYSGNPAPQRSIWAPLMTTAVLLMVLLFGLTASIMVAIWGDHIDEPQVYVWAGVFIVGTWVIWAMVFYYFGKAGDLPMFAQRLSRWLVKGSIVELLVAVPCHIIVRHREDCCAPGITFFGIAAGLVVMAVAFGPAVLLLVNARMKQAYARRTQQQTIHID